MTAIKQIFKSKSFSSLLGNGMGAVLGLLTFSVLARFLDKPSFGAWLVFLTIYGIFDTLRIGMVLNALVKNLAQAKTEEEAGRVIGSSLFISLVITLIYVLLNGIGFLICYSLDWIPEYQSFFKWFILIAIFSLPHNFASWILNARLEIINMSVLRILSQLVFIAYIFLVIRIDATVEQTFLGYTLAQILPSLYALFKSWAGFHHLKAYTREMLSQIFHFGKYSMGTLVGSNLLRSSDTFIITSTLGSGAVATYNVPLRMIEIIEMPLRSFTVTALPGYAKLVADGKFEELREVYERRTGLIFYLLLPVSFLSFLLADWVVLLLGGSSYQDAGILLRLFASYMAILPLDKFSGVLLDTINKPNLNFYKVMIMLAVNVAGDYLGILLFGNLHSVAIASTLTFIAGMLFGYYQLKKYTGIRFPYVLSQGWVEFIFWIKKIVNRHGSQTAQ